MLLSIFGGLYLAWNTGANDVANAIGPSVGSGAVSIHTAIWMAVVFEFFGAAFAGGSVTQTVTQELFAMSSADARAFELALMTACSILSAAIVMNAATVLGWPISTTQSIMGALFGGVLALGGAAQVNFEPVVWLTFAWIITPLLAFLIALFAFRLVSSLIYGAEEPQERMRLVAPYLCALTAGLITSGVIIQGSAADVFSLPTGLGALIASGITIIVFLAVRPSLNRLLGTKRPDSLGEAFDLVDRGFLILQIPAACFLAFAHGSNDVANAAAPLSMVFHLLMDGEQSDFQMTVPILMVSAIGIVIGLVTFGSKVVTTVSRQITHLTPVSAFVAVFSSAVLVLLSTKLGIPVSTTHIVVAAIVGVGAARAVASIDQKVVREILLSWILTVPATVTLTFLIGRTVALFVVAA